MAWSLILCSSTANAAPPTCKTVEQGGTTIDVCERTDTECLTTIAKEQFQNPSDQSNGCLWPAEIYKSHIVASGVLAFVTHVSLVASYRDSERMDITIDIENANHTHSIWVRKDVPIIVRDNIPSASADFIGIDEPLGVPLVDAVEKGGKKVALHKYR